MFETYLTVIGRLITDVNQRTVSTGDTVCGFRMVATERRFNKDAQEWANGDQLFINVTCWRKLAEHVAVSLFKGDQAMVHGRLYVKEFEVNGESRSMLELDARAVGPNLSMCTAILQRPHREGVLGDPSITGGVVAA